MAAAAIEATMDNASRKLTIFFMSMNLSFFYAKIFVSVDIAR